ncbi:MAG: bifunctional folylpolyglutamate synthase/dihydrofolate synthase [Lachnospiraceae bacterium]|nr:bifunctional folylpolyglutamate synthase/dihydrofolate synthase [Lachnospiraceae bacterium]
MTYDEILTKLTSKSFFSKFAGLDRMRETMTHFGNPEEIVPVVHVAGTNGKGSVCAMLHSVLKEAGYRVGLFTSPYLHDFRERIQINGELIPKEKLTALAEEVFAYSDTHSETPNQFELLTILAFLYFTREKCDIIILETGLGGTFDPTNIVTKPLATVIMNIGLDHCAVLGNTIEEIADAKAGIIKEGVPAVLYPSCDEALSVLKKRAEEKNAPVVTVDLKQLKPLPAVPNFEHFRYKTYDVECNLLGRHQQKNCAVCIETIEVLRKNGFLVEDTDLLHGLSNVYWPGRMELLHTKPAVYVDGGHNPQCISAAEDFFTGPAFSGKRIHVITGILADKDYRTMLSLIRGFAADIRFWRSDHPRTIPKEDLPALCEEFDMVSIENPDDEIRELVENGTDRDIVLCIGSLYMTDRIRSLFQES